MTFQEIYAGAIRLLAEDAVDGDTGDYDERAPYVLATFCTQSSPIDQRYRTAYGLPEQSAFVATYVDLSGEFPLCDVFIPAATYYLCAMLALDENEDVSEKFFAEFTDAISSIQSDLPATSTTIVDRYGLM